jgi:hypothetical protein
MAKKVKTRGDKKIRRKELMAKILGKISDAMKEYATPASERKVAKKIKKASREISTIIVH